MNTSRTRDKPSGWAAFALKQQEKQPLEQDPFPPITMRSPGSLPASGNHNRKNDFSNRSSSSTLSSPINFPTLPDARNGQRQLHMGASCKTQDNKPLIEDSNATALKKLKEVHSWADGGFIGYIVKALDNDINQASILLEGMVLAGIFEDGREREEVSVPSRKYADPSALTATPVHNPEELLSCSKDECDFSRKDDCGKTARTKFLFGDLKSLPLEPEWEEDEDIYVRYRKDAIRVMRSASQHSRAARNAFLRGDHSSAKQHSLKACEEWMVAERLNSQAAMEILRARNDGNDVWKLDLHGLHATEAIQVLREHLQKIESQISFNRSISPSRNNRPSQKKDADVLSSSVKSLISKDTDNSTQSHASRQISSSLQVITGVGNHSRGRAALPAAVRSFLNENGYHFDEIRPGVITVRPKFRRR